VKTAKQIEQRELVAELSRVRLWPVGLDAVSG